MPKCTFRAKPTDQETCNVLADAGKQLCPRHEFLHEVQLQQEASKEEGRLQAAAAGVGGRLPRNRMALQNDGYVYQGASECAGCGVVVEWWRTPAGKRAPFNRMTHPDAVAVSHFVTCPKRDQFRRSA